MANAEIHVGFRPYVEPPPADLTGRIVVHGDWRGILKVSGSVSDPGDGETVPLLSGGHIIIDGAINNYGRITVAGDMGLTSEFITVNYPGGYVGDPWTPGCYVILGDEWIEGSEPDRHVWEITPCKGDMNNDGVTNYGDINPFTLALSNPEGYSTANPGLGGTAADEYLGGSRIYHGDINGDGVFNFGDINPFVALLAAGGCGPEEGGGEMMMMELPEDGGEANATPEGMAAGLANVVPPQGYDDLLGLVGFAIENAPDEAQSAYWLAVYGALTE